MENAASNFAALERFKWFLKVRGARELILNSTKPATDYTKAAVLFLMRERQCGELEVLLTKRSYTLPSHAGKLPCAKSRNRVLHCTLRRRKLLTRRHV